MQISPVNRVIYNRINFKSNKDKNENNKTNKIKTIFQLGFGISALAIGIFSNTRVI